MNIEEYANKIEMFVSLWREEMIADAELVQTIRMLTHDVTYLKGGYVIPSDSSVLPTPRKPVD